MYYRYIHLMLRLRTHRRVGVMISDLGLENEPAGVKAYYAGCTTMGEIAKKASEMPGADFVCLRA